MRPETQILALGLVTWLVTQIVVESELCRPLRRYVVKRTAAAQSGLLRRQEAWDLLRLKAGKAGKAVLSEHPKFLVRAKRRHTAWSKVQYLVTCHLCAGTWIGFGIAIVAGGPFANPILNGLAYKAAGHITLEIVARVQR